jgi:serine/threonine protein kinase
MKVGLDGEWDASGLRSAVSDGESMTDIGDEPFLATPALEIERGAVLAGRYQIEATIGRGGSGLVLRAFDRISQGPVAVKILKPELAADPHWVDRFSRELRLARQIQHPNVCRVYDIGEADGHKFLTMELASGGPLRAAVRPAAPVRPLADLIADARALVAGMAAIHAAGIVHRDIKPENLLRMDDGRLVVSDFGLATNPALSPAVTRMVGTPSYMAPEMSMGDPADLRSDVWAIGIVMHEILFRRRPEWDVTAGERSFRPPVGREAPAVLRALARLCGECADENPAARPIDASEIARRFARAEASTSFSAWGRSRQHQRRWGWALVAGVTVASLVVARDRWWTAASASSAQSSERARRVESTGAAVDWSASSVIASLPGKVHCLSTIRNGGAVRVIWGAPKRAEDIDLSSRVRSVSALKSATFEEGCPETSPSGEDVLFEKSDIFGRRQIFLSALASGDEAQPMVIGSEPLWLPNGKEFLFSIDEAHASIFSVPTMTSNVISDPFQGQKTLIQKSISPDGSAFTLGYLDESLDRIVVLHQLPSLEILDSVTFPKHAKSFRLTGPRSMVFSQEESTHDTSLAEFDWRSRLAVRAGLIPGKDLTKTIVQAGHLAFVSRALGSDIWMFGSGSAPRRLTEDGEDYSPSLSTGGDLIVENRQPSGDVVVRMYKKGVAGFQTISTGPTDLSPSFLPDGTGWLFVKGDRKAIMRCAGLDGDDCRPVYVSKDLPRFPVASPSGKSIAFVTAVGRSRLFVLAGAAVRDLGPARMDCSPVWSSERTTWVLQGPDSQPEWIELDVASGERTGNRLGAGPRGSNEWDCPYDNLPPTSFGSKQVRAISWEQSTIRTHQSESVMAAVR